MSAALIFPILPGGRMAPAAVGPPVPTVAALGRELRQSLPPALLEALDRIGDQIEVEILDPLLCAASVEQLARTFERVFPKSGTTMSRPSSSCGDFFRRIRSGFPR